MSATALLIIVPLASVVAAVIGPLLLSWLNGRTTAEARREDWKRQDEMAARAAGVAQASADAAKLAADTAVEAVAAVKTVEVKLDVVHGLVNSAYLALLVSERDGVVRELGLMKSIAGGSPSQEQAAGIEATAEKIADLDKEIGLREEATTAAAK